MASRWTLLLAVLLHFLALATGRLVGGGRGGAAQRATPTEKVVDLLKGMQESIANESKAEASTYEAFACFCKDKTKDLSGSLRTGQNDVDLLSSEIASKTAHGTGSQEELLETKRQLEWHTSELEATKLRCEREFQEYEAADADLVKAVSSLDGAMRSMEASKGAGLLASRVQVQKKIVDDPAIAEAMRIVDAGPKWQEVRSFLQRRVDPSSPEYGYHSQGILGTLQELRAEFAANLDEYEKEWAKEKVVCDEEKAAYQREIGIAKQDIFQLEGKIGALSTRSAQAKQELVETSSMMKDDKLYLDDLTVMCERRAQEWDQRSSTRKDELEAISKAVGILENKVKATSEAAVKRAFLQMPSHGLLQLQAVARSVSFLQRTAKKAGIEPSQRATKALELLRKEGGRLHSGVIGSLVSRLAADPFVQVKGLIQELLERLLDESTAEATKQGFCNTEMAKAEQSRDTRLSDVLQLSAELGTIEAKRASLDVEMSSLSEALGGLSAAANESATLRTSEQAANVEGLRQAREGLAALNEAIAILTVFYTGAAKDASLVQARAAASASGSASSSPVSADAGFEGTYGGKQAESKGVFGLLEVIKSDFERTIARTDAEEKQAAAEFVKLDQGTKTDQGGKSTKLELNAEDLSTATNTLDAKMQEMKSYMNLVDAALKELEELKPTCVDNVETYEDRVAQREAEVKALQKALCLLDEEGVEECSGQEE